MPMASASVRRTFSPSSHQTHRSAFSPSSPLRARGPTIPYHPPLLLRLLLFFFASGFILGFTLFSSPYKHQSQPQPDPEPVIPSDDLPDQSVRKQFNPVPEHKLLIVVTPTYNRAAQAYFLHRLAQTLRLVPPPLLWIVVETGSKPSTETASILSRSGVMYRHISCKHTSGEIKDRGVHQRNKALDLIEHHRLEGIVYFADDDNIYSIELFDRLRDIRYMIFLKFQYSILVLSEKMFNNNCSNLSLVPAVSGSQLVL